MKIKNNIVLILALVFLLGCNGCAALWIGLGLGAGLTAGSIAVTDIMGHSDPQPTPSNGHNL